MLILREVLRWQATEVAELLDTTVASVNSALQRARASLAACDLSEASELAVDADQQELLGRYVDAFERYDIPRLVKLLPDDAVQSMPPFAMWMQGADEIGRWLLGGGGGCRGSRPVPTSANGGGAFGQYTFDPAGGYSPWSLQVIEISGRADLRDPLVPRHRTVRRLRPPPSPRRLKALGRHHNLLEAGQVEQLTE